MCRPRPFLLIEVDLEEIALLRQGEGQHAAVGLELPPKGAEHLGLRRHGCGNQGEGGQDEEIMRMKSFLKQGGR